MWPATASRAAVPDVVRAPLLAMVSSDGHSLVGRTQRMDRQGRQLAEQAGANIIDFNMGCPRERSNWRAGARTLMREPELAARLIEAAVNGTSRPVTLKMRLGWDDNSRNAPQIAALADGWA